MDTIIKRAEERLSRIANVLILNASFISDLGLLTGKFGIAVFFYHYSRYSGNKLFEDYADELIDEIYGEIHAGCPVDFASGLMGIGWGIEYLVNERFLEADTDQVLKDIDGIVFKASLKNPVLTNDNKELFGFGLYYIARLSRRENDAAKQSMEPRVKPARRTVFDSSSDESSDEYDSQSEED